MFVAAMLDQDRTLSEPVVRALEAVGADIGNACQVTEFNDGTLTGLKFTPGSQGDRSHKIHSGLTAIIALLRESNLGSEITGRAESMFTDLGKVEAAIHGVSLDDVHFHEVGAWDSIADIVAASAIICAVQPATWSISAVPLGSGTIETAHGTLPIPAPATARLLEGFPFVDDGVPGERVTPTGAAILRSLAPVFSVGTAPKVLKSTGYGFGQRRMNGRSNVLRVTRFSDNVDAVFSADQVLEVGFEVDDQTAEDLSTGLDRLRETEGVRDVVQWPVVGKKGRMAVHVAVLADIGAQDQVISACFSQTSTIGIRWCHRDRFVLSRREVAVGDEKSAVSVKIVERPDGTQTAKAEHDDIAGMTANREDRKTMAYEAEQQALAAEGKKREK